MTFNFYDYECTDGHLSTFSLLYSMTFTLRKVAQTNAAVGSPSRPSTKYADMGTSTPPRPQASTLANGHSSPLASRSSPMTPRTRMMLAQSSPCERSSLSESHEFDWEAAKLHKPPPYGSPMEGARAKAARKSEAGLKSNQKRIIKRPNWLKRYEKIVSKTDPISDFALQGYGVARQHYR